MFDECRDGGGSEEPAGPLDGKVGGPLPLARLGPQRAGWCRRGVHTAVDGVAELLRPERVEDLLCQTAPTATRAAAVDNVAEEPAETRRVLAGQGGLPEPLFTPIDNELDFSIEMFMRHFTFAS